MEALAKPSMDLGSIWVQDLLVLCGHSVNCGVAGDVCDQDCFIGPGLHWPSHSSGFAPWCSQASHEESQQAMGLVHDQPDIRLF